MEQALSLLLVQREELGEPGTLGSIVMNMYRFLNRGKRPETVLRDRVNDGEVLAGNYFLDQEYRYLVRPEFLPLDFDVKAAYIPKTGERKDRPSLELSPVDMNMLEKLTEEADYFRLNGQNVCMSGQIIARLKTIHGKLQKSGKRTRTRVTLYSRKDQESYAARLADLIFDNNYFLPGFGAEDLANSVPIDIKIEQDMRIRQLIEYEQVPLLLQVFRQTTSLIESMKILQLPREEVMQRLEQDSLELRDIMPYVAKLAISRIRKAADVPLTWKQASKIYWNMIRRTTTS